MPEPDKYAELVERPEWLECKDLRQSLAESRKRHRGGRIHSPQLTRHQAELFWHCDEALAQIEGLRAENERLQKQLDEAYSE